MTIFFRSLIYPELNKIFSSHTPAPQTLYQKFINLFYNIFYGYQPGSAQELCYLREKAISALNSSSSQTALIRYSQAFKARAFTTLSQPPQEARIGSLVAASLKDNTTPLHSDKQSIALATIHSQFGAEPFPYIKTALMIGAVAVIAFGYSYLTSSTLPSAPPPTTPFNASTPAPLESLPQTPFNTLLPPHSPEPLAQTPSLQRPFWPLDVVGLSPYQLGDSLSSTVTTLQSVVLNVAIPTITKASSYLFTTSGLCLLGSAGVIVVTRKIFNFFYRVQARALTLPNNALPLATADDILQKGVAAIPRPLGFHHLVQDAGTHASNAGGHVQQILRHVIQIGRDTCSPTWWLPINVIRNTAAVLGHAGSAVEETALTVATVPGFFKLFYDRYLGPERGTTPWPAFQYAEDGSFRLAVMTTGDRDDLSTPIPTNPIAFLPANALKNSGRNKLQVEAFLAENSAKEAKLGLDSIPQGTLPMSDAFLLAQFCKFSERYRDYHHLQTTSKPLTISSQQRIDSIVNQGTEILRILADNAEHAELPLLRRALDYLMLLSHNLEIANPQLDLIAQIRSHFRSHSSQAQRDLEQVHTYLSEAFKKWHPNAPAFMPILNPALFRETHPHQRLWGMVHAQPVTRPITNQANAAAQSFNPHLQALGQSLLLNPFLSLLSSTLLTSSTTVRAGTKAHIVQSDSLHQGTISPDAGSVGAYSGQIPWIGPLVQPYVQGLAKQRSPQELPQTLIDSLKPSLVKAQELGPHVSALMALTKNDCEALYRQDPSIKDVLRHLIDDLRQHSNTLKESLTCAPNGLTGLSRTYNDSASAEYTELLTNIRTLHSAVSPILECVERLHRFMPLGQYEVSSLSNSPAVSRRDLANDPSAAAASSDRCVQQLIESTDSSLSRSPEQRTNSSTTTSLPDTQPGTSSSSNSSDNGGNSPVITPGREPAESPRPMHNTSSEGEADQNNEQMPGQSTGL